MVYDDNTIRKYVPGTCVRGQFLAVEILISPLGDGLNFVEVIYWKPELEQMLQLNTKRVVTDGNLALTIRQMSLHADMAAGALRWGNSNQCYNSAPSARLKQLKRIRSRTIQELGDSYSRAAAEIDYILEEFSDIV